MELHLLTTWFWCLKMGWEINLKTFMLMTSKWLSCYYSSSSRYPCFTKNADKKMIISFLERYNMRILLLLYRGEYGKTGSNSQTSTLKHPKIPYSSTGITKSIGKNPPNKPWKIMKKIFKWYTRDKFNTIIFNSKGDRLSDHSHYNRGIYLTTHFRRQPYGCHCNWNREQT